LIISSSRIWPGGRASASSSRGTFSTRYAGASLTAAAAGLSAETGLAHRPSAEGQNVAGVYRQRITLASGRFAMIDDGMGFQLVPWRPALEQQLGHQVSGVMAPGGNVDWNFGRKRGIGI
jgi:hypothetical protein